MARRAPGEEQTLLDPAASSSPSSPNKKRNTVIVVCMLLFVVCVIAGMTAGIVLSIKRKSPQTVILLSLDGFRFDYLDRGHSPTLAKLASEGVRATSMKPIFPSKTFPNHYTVVTGLYAESHGIVSNTMFDPETNKTFRISDPAAVSDPTWWGGEPIWNTVEFQGQTAACCFWPGSEAPIQGITPSYWLQFDKSMTNEERVDQVLEWLQLPTDERPNFITLYFNNVDDFGHKYGPEDGNMTEALVDADQALKRLVEGLSSLSLYDKVNLIVTGDHGMTTITYDRVIFLEDYIDLSTVDIIDWSPITAIRPKEGFAEAVYANLSAAAPTGNFSVYQRDGPNFIPTRYHYTSNNRIAPIILEAELGFSVTTRKEFEEDPTWYGGGNHGFDNEDMHMHTTFVGRGPQFKKGVMIDSFANVEVYNLIARILELKPAPNNGTENSALIQQALRD